MDVSVIDFFRGSSFVNRVGASDREGEENPEEKPEDELVVEIDLNHSNKINLDV